MRSGTVPEPGSGRAASDVVIEMLRQDGIYVRPSTLRQWVYRRRIKRYPNGYDLEEVAEYVLGRVTCGDR